MQLLCDQLGTLATVPVQRSRSTVQVLFGHVFAPDRSVGFRNDERSGETRVLRRALPRLGEALRLGGRAPACQSDKEALWTETALFGSPYHGKGSGLPRVDSHPLQRVGDVSHYQPLGSQCRDI